MDNLFFKIILIGIMAAAFMILGIGFVAADAANEKHKSQIIQLNNTIEQQDNLIEAVQEDADMKINKLMIERNKAIKERNQYKKKLKRALSQRIIKSCNDGIALRTNEVTTVYDCRPIS